MHVISVVNVKFVLLDDSRNDTPSSSHDQGPSPDRPDQSPDRHQIVTILELVDKLEICKKSGKKSSERS